jgi:hypothetical protein
MEGKTVAKDAADRIAANIIAAGEIVGLSDLTIQQAVRAQLAKEAEGIATALAGLLRDYDVECGENEHAEIANVIRAHLCGPNP